MHDYMASILMHCPFKLLLLYRTDGIVLAYLNCHTFILLVVVFTLVGQLTSYIAIYLFVYSWRSVAPGYYLYCCLPNNQ